MSLSPYLMSLALKADNNWHNGYKTMMCIQGVIALIMILSLPLWKKVKLLSNEEETPERIASIPEMLKNSIARPYLLITMGSCAIESVCLGWGSTFLVNTMKTSPDVAAKLITLYFVGMTLGRFLSGIISKKLSPFRIIFLGEAITVAAILIVIFSANPLLSAIGLLLVGLGNGPLFPNLTHLAPIIFGKDVSQSYIGIFMSASYVSILSSPAIFSFIAGRFSTDLLPYFLLIAFVITFISTSVMYKKCRNKA